MLDQLKDDEPEDVVEDPVVEAEETPEDQPEELVVTIEGEEPEVDEDAEAEAELGEKGRHALKAVREAAKAARAEVRDLKAKLAEKEAAAKPVVEDIGPEPTSESCGFNDALFRQKTIEWHEKKRVADAKQEEAKAEAKAKEEAYSAKLTRYHEERGKVGVDDDAQAVVVAALSSQQQAALMDASQDPAKVVAALSKTPKILAELAGLKEIHKFTYRLAQIEGKITVTQKTPPPLESRIRGVAASDNVSSVPLEKLRTRAETSGDYTEYLAEKRRRAASGAKA